MRAARRSSVSERVVDLGKHDAAVNFFSSSDADIVFAQECASSFAGGRAQLPSPGESFSFFSFFKVWLNEYKSD